MSRSQLRGVAAIRAALEGGVPPSLILLLESGASDAALEVARAAEAIGVPILRESDREMRRMSSGESPVEILGLAGPARAVTLEGLMDAEGIVFVLAGLRYPGNVGFILRSLEVAGGAGVVLDSDWGAAQREEALRIGMRPERFFPLVEADTAAAVSAARNAGRRVVALETSGRRAPWEVDLRGPVAILVGSETTGIANEILDRVDEVVAIPIDGFIPSYNVQAATGVLLGEWMRQRAEKAHRSPR